MAPIVAWLCTDEAVTGAPFYVMRFVDGLILRDEPTARSVPETLRGAAADSLVDDSVDAARSPSLRPFANGDRAVPGH